MIRLTLLGGLGLVSPDKGSIHSVLQQPKRLAVLVYLTLAGPAGFQSRDTALALFWPEATEKKARRALNSTLHFLREALGDDVVVSRGSGEMGISPNALWCDVVEFGEALKRGDRTGALNLYGGDLLPGFSISAGPEFDQWLDGERTRLRRSASSAAWKLAESAEQVRQFSEAAAWAYRSAELSLDGETSIQDLLRLLDRIGDRSGALQAYDVFKRRLVHEYDTEPSPETKQIVARLRSRPDSKLILASGKSEPDVVGAPTPLEAVELDQSARRSDTLSSGASGNGQNEPTRYVRRSSISKARQRSHWLVGIAAGVCSLGVGSFLYAHAFPLRGADSSHVSMIV